MGTMMAVATKYGISAALLAAIGIEESGFQNIAQRGGGDGRGIFQIDIGRNPSVTEQEAFDFNFAADWVASYLRNSAGRGSGGPSQT